MDQRVHLVTVATCGVDAARGFPSTGSAGRRLSVSRIVSDALSIEGETQLRWFDQVADRVRDAIARGISLAVAFDAERPRPTPSTHIHRSLRHPRMKERR